MKKFLVTLIAIITLISTVSFADDLLDASGLSEAVSILEQGGLISNNTQAVDANSTIRVQLDGSYVDFTDANGNVVNPQILSDRTMVPMRKIFETFDADVEWDEASRTVTASTTSKEISLTIDNAVARVKELATGAVKDISLDQAPVIVNDRTLVPVRFIAESLDKEVGWDQSTRTVVIIDMTKLTKYLSSRVTSLQKLFDMNIDAVEAFKSNSVITGKLDYTSEGVAQSLNISGSADIAVNKAEEMESSLKLSVNGTAGDLIEAVKNSGYENIDAKVILKGDKLFVGLLEGNDYNWTDATSSMASINNVSIAYNVDKMSDYQSVMDFIRSSIGELNPDSYATMRSIIDSLSYVLSEQSVKLTEQGTKKVLTIDLDFGEFLKSYMNSESDLDLVMNVVLEAENGKISREDIKIKTNFELSGEDVGLDFEIDSNYSDLNKDFAISLPNV